MSDLASKECVPCRGGVPPRITLDAELYDTEAALRTLVPGAAPEHHRPGDAQEREPYDK